MPGLKKILKAGRSDLCGGIAPPKKYCFVYFSAEVIIGPVRVPLINGGLKKGHQEACAEAYAQKTQATRAQGISTRE